MLCFKSVTKTELITHQCFIVEQYLQSTVLFPTVSPQQVGWVWTRDWEGTQLGQLIPTGQRDIQYCVRKNCGGKKGIH